jgi:putative inorganic carbon (HCO3(-)) transporter
MNERAAAPRPAAVEKLAAASFLLYVAALPWSIAPMSVALALCAVLTLALWVARRTPWSAPCWSAPRLLLIPALAWMAALLLSALFAQDREASLWRVGKGALVGVTWMAAFHARDADAGRRVVRVLLVSAVIAALYGLTLWIGRGAAFPERARGLVGHYMTFAGQLLLWVPVAAGIFVAGSPRAWRWGAAVAALIGGGALAATYTRSAWIGLFVALAVLLALARPRALAILAVLVLALVALAPVSYRDRLASAFDPAHASNVERRHMWEAGLRMFRDHPFTGVGLQDLHPAYERYRPPAAREPAGHLHNVWIQIAATMGVTGLAAFTWLYVTFFRATTARLRERSSMSGIGRGLALGATGALAGFLVAGLFEWNFGDEELLHLLFVLVGLAWATRGWEERPAAADTA